jgi:HlyD family secretion protein
VSHPKRKSRKGRILVVLLLLAGAGTGGLFYASKHGFGGKADVEIQGARVRRGPLRISVLQRGELAAKNSVSIKSEIEGQTTILQLIAEGTIVKKGDLLVRLDSSDLVEKELQQRIARDNADAAYKKAKAQFEIQESQNASDTEAAERKLFFANMDLNKYKEGDLEQLRSADTDKILLAEQKRSQSETTLTWSKTLHDKGFLTQTELDKDDLDFQSAEVQLNEAKLALTLFDKYEDPRKQKQLDADVVEATRGLERAKLQADARIADFQAALTTSEARLKLESDKLAKYDDQLAKTRITAPAEGMVVYSRAEGRMMMGEAMQEGSQVREGQEILTIPARGGMIAQASVHESVLKQVEKGLPCTITVDALPGLEFHGEVQFVALLPDKGNWWANSTQRLYRTEVSISDANPDMRPGMNCGIEILTEEIADTLYVPLQCVHLIKGETVAFTPRVGGFDERKVQVGKQSEKWVQILSGLAEGEEVLLAPPPGVVVPEKTDEDSPKDGAPRAPGVNPKDAKPPPKKGDGSHEDGAHNGGEAGAHPEAQAQASSSAPVAPASAAKVAEVPGASVAKDPAGAAAKDSAKPARDADAKKDAGAKPAEASDAKAAPSATSTGSSEKSSVHR